MNIKGIFQIWTRDGELHEVPLKEAYQSTARAATTARTSRPSTLTSRRAASARSRAGRSPSCAPTRAGS